MFAFHQIDNYIILVPKMEIIFNRFPFRVYKEVLLKLAYRGVQVRHGPMGMAHQLNIFCKKTEIISIIKNKLKN